MMRRARRHPVATALAGAGAVALLWYALASVTGLIFHFMPAGPTLAAAWILRWVADEPPRRRPRIAALASGAAIALAMTVLLAQEGRPLDDPALTGLALAAGVAIGAWLLRPAALESAAS